jgi:peroxiredoxin
MIPDRALAALVAALGATLVALHVAIKPGFDQQEVNQVAVQIAGPSDWRGRTADDFELPLREGSTFKLSDHVGREVIVLNFFATWCVPCRAEMPELQYYTRKMRDEKQPFLLLAIDAQEAPPQVDAFVSRLALTMPVAIDSDGGVMKKYGVDAFPTTVVIGADGKIKLYEAGAISNADVAFAPIVAPEFAVLRSPDSTPDARRRAYEEALNQQAPPARRGWTPPDAKPADGELTGRALSIAQAMPCPCGCDDKVITCTCHTAKSIKARLREQVDDKLTDGEVMQRLNKEFCMKGM